MHFWPVLPGLERLLPGLPLPARLPGFGHLRLPASRGVIPTGVPVPFVPSIVLRGQQPDHTALCTGGLSTVASVPVPFMVALRILDKGRLPFL